MIDLTNLRAFRLMAFSDPYMRGEESFEGLVARVLYFLENRRPNGKSETS